MLDALLYNSVSRGVIYKGTESSELSRAQTGDSSDNLGSKTDKWFS